MGQIQTSLSQTTVFIRKKKMKCICLLAIKTDWDKQTLGIRLSQRKSQVIPEASKNRCRNVSKHP